MPVGCLSTLPHIISHLYGCNPQKILDLGIGTGLYGCAIRQWLDNGHPQFLTEAYDAGDYGSRFTRVLIGVEIFEGYRNPCWQLYTKVHLTSIEAYLTGREAAGEKFDAILLTDVLEHFKAAEGRDILRAATAVLAPGGTLLVATPAVFFSQGAVYGNEYETHRSAWSLTELLDLPLDLELTVARVLQNGSLDEFGHQALTVAYVRR